MSIEIKEGVRLSAQRDGILITPTNAVIHIIETAHDIWVSEDVHNGVMVVTSILDGVHARWSEHWQGNAVDLRTWNLPGSYQGAAAKRCARRLAAELGSSFRVFLEDDHIHADHKPQRPRRP